MKTQTIRWILRSMFILVRELLFLRDKVARRWAARTMIRLARELAAAIVSA